MNIRQAILQTIDLLTEFPNLYRFCRVVVPIKGEEPACLIGHIAAFRGEPAGKTFDNEMIENAIGVDEALFYSRLNHISFENENVGWSFNAAKAAIALRQYVDEYHPAVSEEIQS